MKVQLKRLCLIPNCNKKVIDLITKKCLSHSDNCSICLDKLGVGDDTAMMKCGHQYHSTCLYKWLNNGVAEQTKAVTQKKVVTEVQKKKTKKKK